MNNEEILLLKKYIENKEFDKYNSVIKKEIIKYFVEEIKKVDSNYLYSSMVELLEDIESYLEIDKVELFKYFYKINKEQYKDEILSNMLTDICQKIFL